MYRPIDIIHVEYFLSRKDARSFSYESTSVRSFSALKRRRNLLTWKTSAGSTAVEDGTLSEVTGPTQHSGFQTLLYNVPRVCGKVAVSL